MSVLKKVSKQEFVDFINNYPNELKRDYCQIGDPPMETFNDFKVAKKWPDSVVARVVFNYEFGKPENPNLYEYFILDAKNESK